MKEQTFLSAICHKKEYYAPMVDVTKVSVEDGFRLSYGEVADPTGYGITEGVTGSNESFDGSDFH